MAAIKSDAAFRTIGEVSAELGVAQHVLRYWETRFPQLRPVQRSGNRRHYRPEDVALLRRIHGLLAREGYTVRGVQQLLARGDGSATVSPAPPPPPTIEDPLLAELRAVRDLLAAAIARS